jgi:hypothetical protein
MTGHQMFDRADLTPFRFMDFPFGPRMSRDHINELLARST